MKKLIHIIIAGAKEAPAILLIFYISVIILDLLTTYIASPDLKAEWNWFIRQYKLEWNQIIILTVVFIVSMIVLFTRALNIFRRLIVNTFKENKPLYLQIFKRPNVIFWFSILVLFYTHLSYSIFVIINNYFHYIFLNKIQNILSDLANSYIQDFIFGREYIYIWITIIFIILGFFLAIRRIGILKKDLTSE